MPLGCHLCAAVALWGDEVRGCRIGALSCAPLSRGIRGVGSWGGCELGVVITSRGVCGGRLRVEGDCLGGELFFRGECSRRLYGNVSTLSCIVYWGFWRGMEGMTLVVVTVHFSFVARECSDGLRSFAGLGSVRCRYSDGKWVHQCRWCSSPAAMVFAGF